MANIKLSFLGTDDSKTELQCYLNTHNEIFITINPNELHYGNYNYICLDKSTAIKLSKTLRTEINKMEDVNNG